MYVLHGKEHSAMAFPCLAVQGFAYQLLAHSIIPSVCQHFLLKWHDNSSSFQGTASFPTQIRSQKEHKYMLNDIEPSSSNFMFKYR